MSNYLTRATLVGAISCALAQAALAQILLQNASFEDSPFFITPWELVNPSNLSNPRLVKDSQYGNFFSVTLRAATRGGMRQAFSIGGTSSVICAFSAYWRSTWQDGNLPQLGLEVTRKSDNVAIAWEDFELRYDRSRDGIWQPVGYRFSLPPGDYWASVVLIAHSSYNPSFDLDEVVLRQATLPIISPMGRTSSMCDFSVLSSDERVWHVLFVALQRLDNPIPIPGIRGALELDPFRDGGLLILGVKLGSASWTLPYAPIAALDRTIFLQALDFNPILTVMQFGSRTGVLYYK